MTMMSIGDLASTLIARNQNTTLRADMQRLTDELGTGITTDIHAHLGGDFSYLSQIDRDMERLNGYKLAADETKVFFDSVNRAVQRVNQIQVELAERLITPAQLSGTIEGGLQVESREMLRESMVALNAQSAGRFAFSGQDVDAPPLADVDVLLSNLSAAIAGETNAADILTAAQDWFDDPAGYDTVVYGGASESLDAIRIGPGVDVEISIRADDDRFKKGFRNLALTTLMTEPALGFTPAVISDLSQVLLAETLSSQTEIANMQADLGFKTERLTDQAERNRSEATALEYARRELIGADPYEVTVELQNVQTRLDTFYTVLSRSSGLSLVNYLS